MHSLLIILFMAVIGAIIGAFTNHVAIKMLFRPYKAWYIGKRKVPFTPGLIPSRQNEMAAQMGKMVTEHLVTSESLKTKCNDPVFKERISKWAQDELTSLLKSERTLEEWIEKTTGIKDINHVLSDKLEFIVKIGIKGWEEKQIKEALSPEWLSSLEQKIPFISQQVLHKGIAFLENAEGKEFIQSFIEQFMSKQNAVVSFFSSFVKQDKMAEKAQAELIRLLQSDNAHEAVEKMLTKEFHELKHKKINEILQQVDEKKITTWLMKKSRLNEIFQKPLYQLTKKYEERMLNFVPFLVEKGTNIAASKIDMIFKGIDIESMVTKQVETFSLERLEEMVLGIIKNELHMITLLGGILGGVIGIFQGIITLLFS